MVPSAKTRPRAPSGRSTAPRIDGQATPRAPSGRPKVTNNATWRATTATPTRLTLLVSTAWRSSTAFAPAPSTPAERPIRPPGHEPCPSTRRRASSSRTPPKRPPSSPSRSSGTSTAASPTPRWRRSRSAWPAWRVGSGPWARRAGRLPSSSRSPAWPTLATPYLCRPMEHGADLVVHSATKFIGGHGTSIGGVVVESGRFPWDNGHFPLMTAPVPSYGGLTWWGNFAEYGFLTRLRSEQLRDVGATMAPLNAFLFLIGLETLALRMPLHVANAQKVAEFLEGHAAVDWVNY